jgi:hypothetical protein
MDRRELFINGVWQIEENSHEGMSIRLEGGGRYFISAWAENWDELWCWEAEITPEELDAIIASPSAARWLLQAERVWRVIPPSSVPRDPYIQRGRLSYSDGFMDGGTGGKSWSGRKIARTIATKHGRTLPVSCGGVKTIPSWVIPIPAASSPNVVSSTFWGM